MTPTIGSRLRVRTNSGSHNYTIGSTVTVVHVDNDGTVRARRPDGSIGNWLAIRDAEPGEPSLWSALRADLPEDVVCFLSAFEGLEELTVRDDIAEKVLLELPDLLERIVAEGRRMGSGIAEVQAAGEAKEATDALMECEL